MSNDGNKKAYILRIALFALVAVFAVGAAASIACYVAFKLDVLFLPMALCIVFALILFTYARHIHVDPD